jgi:hypothetical protein
MYDKPVLRIICLSGSAQLRQYSRVGKFVGRRRKCLTRGVLGASQLILYTTRNDPNRRISDRVYSIDLIPAAVPSTRG